MEIQIDREISKVIERERKREKKIKKIKRDLEGQERPGGTRRTMGNQDDSYNLIFCLP
jgi:hypothetical protein